MATIETLTSRHCPRKSWGWEEWIVNNDMYCGKRLHFEVLNASTSLHFHMDKHETMYVEDGTFLITTIDMTTAVPTLHVLKRGESLVIIPGTAHRIKAHTVPSVLVEFSTHHEDSDSYRIQK